jgi:hypothetical protein
MIHIRITDKIDANLLIQKIQNLISKSDITVDSFLQIKVVNIAYDDIAAIPKLEQK